MEKVQGWKTSSVAVTMDEVDAKLSELGQAGWEPWALVPILFPLQGRHELATNRKGQYVYRLFLKRPVEAGGEEVGDEVA